ncbi:MAG: HIT family protein [Rhizobiaceae bacterium]
MKWKLDARLESASLEIGNMRVSHVRLVDDSRWLWLTLMPRRTGITEIHDLVEGDIVQSALESSRVAQFLKQYSNCRKINTAAIGNIVDQLHIHVVARNEGDANWPGPIWGHGEAVPYEKSDCERLLADLEKGLKPFLV